MFVCNQDNQKSYELIFMWKLVVNDHHQSISLEFSFKSIQLFQIFYLGDIWYIDAIQI